MIGRWIWGIVVALGIGLATGLAMAIPAPSAASLLPAGVQATPSPTPTTVPFLHPPFARVPRVTSYFDHCSPDGAWDDTIVIFNGEQASAIDGILDRLPTFRGGYWLPETRWYVYYDGHNAYDYGTGAGMTILAAASGEVVFAGTIPSSCATPLQYVCLKHAGGYRTFYLHLEGVAVRQGEWVQAGDPLGISGNSGCSLGPHLHFAVEHEGKFTDPYGWKPADVPDPLLEYGGQTATWLWVPDQPPLPAGKLTAPAPGTRTNGTLSLAFTPDPGGPPVARVAFLAFYGERWHDLGVDTDGSDGWTWSWDTRAVPEGEVWVHAWAVDGDGRVGKGNPIVTDIAVDRQGPVGFIVGLGSEEADAEPAAGAHLWLYAASYDPASTTAQVTFLVRDGGGGDWREIGDARWLHSSNWLLEWDADLADGTRFDVVARLVDGAGNATLTEPVEGLLMARDLPSGELVRPAPEKPFTSTLDLVYTPHSESPPADRVAFYAWYDAAWHAVGLDRDGSDGWAISWDPARVADQARVRVQARPYDTQGRVNAALPQVTGLTLDRTPPSAGYIRPQTGGVARPDVDQRVWAWDEGSGVARVEFYVNDGRGWLQIGEDRSARDGWSVLWDGRGIEDGLVGFSARVYDQAGNSEWTTDQRNVALDRMPPAGGFAFPEPDMRLEDTITLTLDVTDTVSGLDRAIFYAMYDDRWHHLGADTDHEDGFSLAWDTSTVGERDGVTLTAWIYDRAGNHVELPYVERLAVGGSGSPPRARASAATPTPAAAPPTASTMAAATTPMVELAATPAAPAVSSTTSATSAPTLIPPPATPSPTAVPSATVALSPSASWTPSSTRPASPTATSSPSATWASSPTWTVPPTAAPAPTSPPVPSGPARPVPPAFWYLIAVGLAVGLALLILSLRNIWLSR